MKKWIMGSAWMALFVAVALAWSDQALADATCGAEVPQPIKYSPKWGIAVQTNGYERPNADPQCVFDINSVDRGFDQQVTRWLTTGRTDQQIRDALKQVRLIELREELIPYTIGGQSGYAAGYTDLKYDSTGRYSSRMQINIRDQYQGQTFPIYCSGTLQHELDHHLSWVFNDGNYSNVGHTTDIYGHPASGTALANGVPTYGNYCAAPPAPPLADFRMEQWGMPGDVPLPGRFFSASSASQDLGVYRPSEHVFYLRSSASGEFKALNWGVDGDIPMVGDFFGIGTQQIAQFRPSSGSWYVFDPISGRVDVRQWGTQGDRPIVGNFLGTGHDDIAVFRPSTGTIWIMNWNEPARTASFSWGIREDVTTKGDFLGLGRDQIAQFRPSTGTWYAYDVPTGRTAAMQWGMQGDVPVPGKFFAEVSRTQIAVYRPSTGGWYVADMVSGGFTMMNWGTSTDVPVVGDLAGLGRAQPIAFRPQGGQWWIWQRALR